MTDFKSIEEIKQRYEIVFQCETKKDIPEKDRWAWIPKHFIVVKLRKDQVCVGVGTHMIIASHDGKQWQMNAGERELVEELLSRLQK